MTFSNAVRLYHVQPATLAKRQFVICSNRKDRVVTLSSFEQQETDNSYLEYWLSRPAEERIEEVDRLRREFATPSTMSLNGFREALPRILLLIERGED
jgi:hypothetical protein